MATVQDCEHALERLARRLDEVDPSQRKSGLDRTLSCRITDLDVIFAGRIKDGQLLEVRQSTDARAKVQLTLSSDDLIAMVDGTVKLGPAWASGRIKVNAGVLDMVKLRAIF